MTPDPSGAARARLLKQVNDWLSSHSHTREAEPTLQLYQCAGWLAQLVQAVEDQQRRLRALPIEEMRIAIAEYDECVARWGAATDDLGKDRAAIRGVELFGKGDAAKWIRQLVGMVG